MRRKRKRSVVFVFFLFFSFLLGEGEDSNRFHSRHGGLCRNLGIKAGPVLDKGEWVIEFIAAEVTIRIEDGDAFHKSQARDLWIDHAYPLPRCRTTSISISTTT